MPAKAFERSTKISTALDQPGRSIPHGMVFRTIADRVNRRHFALHAAALLSGPAAYTHRPFSVPRETEPKPFSELQDISRKRFAAMIATTQTRGFPAASRRSHMTALVHAFSRLSFVDVETQATKALLMLCGAALFVSLMFMTYGLDLSPGFF